MRPSQTVAAWLPPLFEAYGRILHPARLGRPAVEERRPVPWAYLAEWAGKELRPDSSIDDLMVRHDGVSWTSVGQAPEEGQLDRQHMSRLCEVLATATTTPTRIWALHWFGKGWVDERHRHLAIELGDYFNRYYRRYLVYPAELTADGGESQLDLLDEA
jgi:hypothetical protein